MLSTLLILTIAAAQPEREPPETKDRPEVIYIDRCGRAADFEAEKLRRQGKIVIRGVLAGYRKQNGKMIPVYRQSC